MADVTLPQLGETVTEGTITRWFKKVGDSVSADEPLFEVSTDKVDTEVPSPIAGTVTEIRVQEGDTVPVGAVIAVVGEAAGAGAAPAPAPAGRPRPAAAEAAPRGCAEAAPAEPVCRAAAGAGRACRTAARSRTGAGRGACSCDRRSRARSASSGSAGEAAPAAAERGGRRRTVRQSSAVAGRSPAGRRAQHQCRSPQGHRAPAGGSRATTCSTTSTRSLHRPAQPAAAAPLPPAPGSGSPRPLPAPAAPAPAAAAPQRTGARRSAPHVAPGERDSTVKLSKIRKLTGSHMVMSKSVSPHAFSVVEVDFANVDVARNEVKAEWKAAEGFGLTYLPFITRAVVEALEEFPHLNASVSEDDLIVHNFIDIGIAVDLEYQGLLVPVVRAAETKRLRAIAPRDQRPRRTGTQPQPQPRRDQRRHVHDLQQRLGGKCPDDADHQPAASGDPVDRRHRPQTGRRAHRRRWRRHRNPSCRQPGHVVGSPGIRRCVRRRVPRQDQAGRSRPATGPPSCDMTLRVRWLGRVPYREALAVQQALFTNGVEDHLLLLEHPHVFTHGPRADLAVNVLVDPASVGAELVSVKRGGDVTYHGPGPARRLSHRQRVELRSAPPITCARSSG